ncbi:MAG: chemotaxis response regulator protein-glutamate methylesterase [Thermoprotei archaeon]|nr:chemotaxis response regulator protein-glutamate methylesterase [Thermoprotei archaeon]
MPSAGKKIRVIIADDSALMRKVLKDALESDGSIEVIGEARNGIEAVNLTLSLNPDVVIMDVVMPRMDGITAIKEIMAKKPTPILVFSSITQEGSKAALDALEAGALEVIAKPGGLPTVKNLGDLAKELIRKVKILATIGTVKLTARLMLKRLRKPQRTATLLVPKKKEIPLAVPAPVVAFIASSTGGPQTLMRIVPKISSSIPAATLIVQHMPPLFTKSLAERLDRASQIKVVEASEDNTVLTGYGYVAPGGYHMLVKLKRGKPVIELDKGPKVHGVRPAADVTMKSIVKVWGSAIVAAVLTGMGRDGAEGAVEIKKAGGYVIAQDERTSIVWGMPRAVIERGAADVVLPVDKIGDEINRVLRLKVRRCPVKWAKLQIRSI